MEMRIYAQTQDAHRPHTMSAALHVNWPSSSRSKIRLDLQFPPSSSSSGCRHLSVALVFIVSVKPLLWWSAREVLLKESNLIIPPILKVSYVGTEFTKQLSGDGRSIIGLAAGQQHRHKRHIKGLNQTGSRGA